MTSFFPRTPRAPRQKATAKRRRTTPSTGSGMVLERSETTILDLPEDVWRMILDLFRKDPTIEVTGMNCFEWREWYSSSPMDLLSIRSTCRMLKTYVDPILFSTMYVDLSSHSVERLEELAKNQAFSDGVRMLRVNLSFLPAYYATNLQSFLKKVIWALIDFTGNIDYMLNELDEEEEWSTRPGRGAERRAFDDAQKKYHSIVDGLRKYVRWYTRSAVRQHMPWPGSPTLDHRYVELLHEAFGVYKQRQKDQKSIVRDMSFIKRVARVIPRFGRLTHMILDDRKRGPNLDLGLDGATLSSLLEDFDDLRLRLQSTFSWDDMRQHEEVWGEREPTRILTELPIACYRAGAPLRNLVLDCFPYHAYDQGFGPLARPESRTNRLDELAAACGGLRSFRIKTDSFMGTHPVGEKNYRRVRRYLGAVCSGPQLESLDLGLMNLGYYTPPDENTFVNIDVGSMLTKMTMTSLSRVTLEYVSMSSADLEAVIGKLSPCLRLFRVTDLRLTTGTYTKAICMLREQVRGASIGREDVSLVGLHGGEFGPVQESIIAVVWKEKYKALMEQVYNYLFSHDRVDNPLDLV